MKIRLACKNEYKYYPDIDTDQGNNKELAEDKRFCIIVRKVTSPAFAQQYMDVDIITGGINLDSFNKLRLNVVRLENPPILDFEGDQAVDENGEKIPSRSMTVEDLFNTQYPEFFPILEDLQMFVGKLETTGIEVKKS